MKNYFLFFILSFVSLFSCQQSEQAKSDEANAKTDAATKPVYNMLDAPEWAKNASIYEVNLRQYTEEGTIQAFMPHIPRLKDMGVDILWFMPMHPISETKRKGELGSPYAVSDYRAINPEFGSMEDFVKMKNEIHRAGMYLIIDWVPNHTGWDHKWIKEHPDYYTKNDAGEIIDPIDYNTGESWGWTDVADLNYDNPKMREAMINDMKYWIADVGIDGFRVDVAHGVPTDFWDKCVVDLMKVKKCFLLAEAEVPHLRNVSGFHMDYGWDFHHLMNDIVKGKHNANDIQKWYGENRAKYSGGYHMHFTSNHDENTWSGTEFDRMGDGHKAFAVLACTFDGMPLVYSGQEEPLRKRLEFFKKDNIGFKDYEYTDFYRSLLTLKKKNKALWNGKFGGEPQRISTNADEQVYAYKREKDGDKVLVILNLSKKPVDVTLNSAGFEGDYMDLFANSTLMVGKEMNMKLKAWDYLVLTNKF